MSDGPDLLERTRMALMEVGADPSLVRASEHPDIIESHRSLDNRVAWRAVSLARMAVGDRTSCFACSCRCWWETTEGALAIRDRCEATRPMTEDCGVDR